MSETSLVIHVFISALFSSRDMVEPPFAKKEPRELKIHGTRLIDNYFWLRNKGTDDVVSYLEEENRYTREMMADTEHLQEVLFQEMCNRIKETDQSAPMKHGDYFYYFRTEKGKDYPIYCRKHLSLDAPEQIILDGNVLAQGRKYMSIESMRVSPDHRMLAYSVDFTGGTTYDIRIVDLSTYQIIETIEQVGGQLEWDYDNKSIFYSELDSIHRDYAVSYHAIGTKPSEDVRIYEEKDTAFFLIMSKSTDRKYLLLKIGSFSSETTEVRIMELEQPHRELELLWKRSAGIEMDVQHHDGYFYFLTNAVNPMTFKLMRTPTSDIRRERWEDVIGEDIVTRFPWLLAFRTHLVLSRRKDGFGSFLVYDFSTRETHDILVPERIYALSVSDDYQEFESGYFRFVLSSPVTPTTVYDYQMATRQLETRKIDEIRGHDPFDFVTERRYAAASDGTTIPISLAYRKGMKLDGTNPLMLYGYGSYGYAVSPDFDQMRLSLMNRGVIFAIAHIRGGGEYGKMWYHQGKLDRKMNTFTDFFACADYLVKQGFTSKEKLCAMGRSAGGLLMGAAVTLRPELFSIVVAMVPFVDVINTMLDDTIPLTTFEYREWGDPRIKKQFKWMLQYSPYDNTGASNYPAMLVTAGYNDPSVAYWEPAKWVARLRAVKTDDNLLLLKTRMDSGHAGFSGRYENMKDAAFIYAFILKTMRMIP